MDISKELQNRLDALNSKVIVELINRQYKFKTPYCEFLPFLIKKDRDIKIEDIKIEEEYTVLLFKKKPYFRACARVKGYEELASLIFEWLDKRSPIETIVAKFDDLQYLKPFPIKDLDTEREQQWLSVKSGIFYYYVVCWNLKNAYANYELLLTEAKQREELKKYYPSLSMHYLRFTTTTNYNTWKYLSGYLMATNEVEKRGTLYVSDFDDKGTSGNFFADTTLFSKERIQYFTNDPKDAVDFFVSKCIHS